MKKARIGIIGCGSMSRHHAKQFTREVPDAQIVALADPNRDSLERYQREVFDPVKQRPPTFADYRAMLAEVELDGVVIVTPHTQHFEQTMDALDARCHVLLEKPMVVSVEHARKLIARAKRARRVVSLAFPQAFTAEFAYVRGLLDCGELGEVVAMQGYITQRWKPNTKGTWRQEPRLSGGGFAYDSGAHLFNAMLYLPKLRATEVMAFVDNRGAPVDIQTAAILRYENGAFGSVLCNGDDVRFEDSVYLSCSLGAVRAGLYGQTLTQWDERGQLVRYPNVPSVPSMHQNFVDCIRGRAQTPCPPIWGLRQALLMDALYKSARTHGPVKVKAE